jgi:hypothetical protein
LFALIAATAMIDVGAILLRAFGLIEGNEQMDMQTRAFWALWQRLFFPLPSLCHFQETAVSIGQRRYVDSNRNLE